MRGCIAALLLLVTSTAGAQNEDRNFSIQNRCAKAASTIVLAMIAYPDDYTALGKYIGKLRDVMDKGTSNPPTDKDYKGALYGAMSIPEEMRKMGTDAVHYAMVSRATTECVLRNLGEASKPRFRSEP